MSDEEEAPEAGPAYPVTEMRVVVKADDPSQAMVTLNTSLPGQIGLHDEALALDADLPTAAALLRLFRESEQAFYLEGERVVIFSAKRMPGPLDEES